MKRLVSLGALLAAVVFVPATKVEALVVTPASVATATGNQTSQAQINAFSAAILGTAEELYKQNVGGSEVGDLAGSYTTQFFNSPTDPEDALITYDGGDIVGPPAFLLVKDGNHSPAWYLFNLTTLGWNGTDDLEINDFWPAGGAISHVSLYGVATTVPEPATFSLLAVGLLGAGVMRRRRSQVS
jgi:hypothetical protein